MSHQSFVLCDVYTDLTFGTESEVTLNGYALLRCVNQRILYGRVYYCQRITKKCSCTAE